MATKKRLEGRVLSVLIADQDHSLVSTARDQVQVTWGGFAGDKHEGVTMWSGGRTPHYPRGTEIRNTRQVTIVSEEEVAEIAALCTAFNFVSALA